MKLDYRGNCVAQYVDKPRPRFVHSEDMSELINLYHLARVPLSGQPCGQYERMLWATKEFAKTHSYVSATGAYKDLCAQLARGSHVG